MTGHLAQGRGSLEECEEGLQQAMLVQRQVLEAVRGDNPELVAAHKQAAADIQTELAGLYATQHKLDQVIPPCLSVTMGYLCLCLSVCLSVSTHLPLHVLVGVVGPLLSAQPALSCCRQNQYVLYIPCSS